MSDINAIDLILSKLDDQSKLIETQGNRLVGIEQAISVIAVQGERLTNIQGHVNILWKKYDGAFESDGIIAQIKSFQAACPKENVDTAIKSQWKVISLIMLMTTAIFLKAFNLI